ncbi:MAG: LuxR C-terminal-related transcriptional regulator [Byssovorax sp.]
MTTRKGNDTRWSAALDAATRLAPAEDWREGLARSLHEALSADLVHVITCPPGDWGQHFHANTYPHDYSILTRAAQSFLPRIEQSGEGFRYAITHHGLVYAPLDVARHRPLAEEMRAAVLAPASLTGWVVTSIIDEGGALLGALAVGTSRSSFDVMDEAQGRLIEVAGAASRTLSGALRLAQGCLPSQARPSPPPGPEPALPFHLLTSRERDVAALVAEGLRNANIAARLDISEATVAVHLKRIFAKLGITTRVDLATSFRRGATQVAR